MSFRSLEQFANQVLGTLHRLFEIQFNVPGLPGATVPLWVLIVVLGLIGFGAWRLSSRP